MCVFGLIFLMELRLLIHSGKIYDIWRFRSFILSSVKREFQSRWTGTQLGAFWVVAQPLATILIFTVIFSRILRPELPRHDSPFAYSVYLCSGIVTWQLFSELLTRSVGIFIEHGHLLKKVSLPKICLPIIAIISCLVNFCIIFILFILFLVFSDSFPGVVVVAVFPVLCIQLMFTVGLGMLLASINVFYRDVQQAVQVLLQFWFWVTPIVYLPQHLPDAAQKIIGYNPMYPLIQAYQGVFLEHSWPEWDTLLYPGLLSLFLIWVGLCAFQRLQGEIVDEL